MGNQTNDESQNQNDQQQNAGNAEFLTGNQVSDRNGLLEAGPSPGDKVDGPTRALTFGEQLVGIGFNPAGDDKVAQAKRLCADLADLLNDANERRETSQFSQRLFSHAVGEILNAQMNVVKVLTLKY